MEGFDKIYLLRKNGTPKANFGYSRNVTFKDYFTKYSDQLLSIMPKSSVGTKVILKNILQDEEELSIKELSILRADINKKLFTRKDYYLEWLKVKKKQEMNTASFPEENTPINPKESSPSVFREEPPSTSKERDEDESRIYSITVDSDSEEETSCILGNSNTQKSRDGTSIAAKQIDDKKTSLDVLKDCIKTYERNVHGQVASKCKGKIYEKKGMSTKISNSGLNISPSNKMKNRKKIANKGKINVHNVGKRVVDCPEIASDPMNMSNKDMRKTDAVGNNKSVKKSNVSLPVSKKISHESRNCQKRRNDKELSSTREIENESKLMTDILIEETLPSQIKQSNVIEQTLGNKADLFSLLNEAISEDTRAFIKPLNKKIVKSKSKITPKSNEPLGINPKSFSSSSTAEKKKEEKKKSDAHDFVIKASTKDNPKPCKESSSEATEIVSQLLDTLLLNIKSDFECTVPCSKTDIKTGSSSYTNLFPQESLPDYATHSNFADRSIEKEANLHDHCNETCIEKEQLRSSTEAIDTVTQLLDTLILNVESISSKESSDTANESMFKVPEVPVRRGARKRITKKAFDYQEDCVKKFQAEEEPKLTAKTKKEYEIPEYGDGESTDTRISSIIRGISRRKRLRNRRRCRTVRGTILVNTTKKLGKKDLSARKNFVLSFRIHKPFSRLVGKKGIRPGKCQQEIEVLNCQTLDDLRLKISCESDFQYLSGDVSDWPYSPSTEVARKKYKGAMFYINNTFYVNTEEGATDYSEVIRKWAEDRGIKVGETKPMDSIKVEDLQLRMGYPYVYVHQGSCEHLVIISRARLLLKKSSLHSSDYPNLTKISRSPVYYCATCSKTPARWIVTGSHLMIHDVNFMCDKCFHRFHYIGTKKIGNFKAWFFKQRALLFY